MKKKILLAALALLLAVAGAEATTVTGTVKDASGAPLASGTVTFTLSQEATSTEPALYLTVTVPCAITNGAIQSCTVEGNDLLSPAGTYYKVRILGAYKQEILPERNYTITQATWDLGSHPPLASAPVAAKAYQTVQDEGLPLPQRAIANFTGAGVACSDDPTNTRTNCAISGGGGGGATHQANGLALAAQDPINFQDSTTIAATNPSLGNVQLGVKNNSVTDAMLAPTLHLNTATFGRLNGERFADGTRNATLAAAIADCVANSCLAGDAHDSGQSITANLFAGITGAGKLSFAPVTYTVTATSTPPVNWVLQCSSGFQGNWWPPSSGQTIFSNTAANTATFSLGSTSVTGCNFVGSGAGAHLNVTGEGVRVADSYIGGKQNAILIDNSGGSAYNGLFERLLLTGTSDLIKANSPSGAIPNLHFRDIWFRKDDAGLRSGKGFSMTGAAAGMRAFDFTSDTFSGFTDTGSGVALDLYGCGGGSISNSLFEGFTGVGSDIVFLGNCTGPVFMGANVFDTYYSAINLGSVNGAFIVPQSFIGGDPAGYDYIINGGAGGARDVFIFGANAARTFGIGEREHIFFSNGTDVFHNRTGYKLAAMADPNYGVGFSWNRQVTGSVMERWFAGLAADATEDWLLNNATGANFIRAKQDGSRLEFNKPVQITGGLTLAGTGGTGQFLKQKTLGGAITVETIATGDLPAHAHAESDVTSLVTDLAAKEATANKNAANGYAGLNASAQIAIGRTPLTTRGDLLGVDLTPALVRIAIGVAGTCLTSNGTDASWGSCGGAHDLLSATHSDTTAGAVARGDVITGQGVTPKWARLAKGLAGQCLQMDGSAVDVTWGSCAGGGSNHNFLSATHPDTVAASPVLGDIVFGNVTPVWTKLAGNITTTRKFLRQTGTGTISADPLWDTLLAGDIPDLDASKITAGVLAIARGGLNNNATPSSDGQIPIWNQAQSKYVPGDPIVSGPDAAGAAPTKNAVQVGGLDNSTGCSAGPCVRFLALANSAPAGSEYGLIVRNIPSGTQSVSGTVTTNQGGSNWSFNFAQYGGVNVGAGNAVHVQPGTGATWDVSDRAARKLGQAFLRNPGDTANMGDATTPVRTDPTGTTTQPVKLDNTTPGTTNGVTMAQLSRTTGTITSATSTVSAAVTGYGAATVTVSGTYAGVTVNFEFSDDAGTTWFAQSCTRTDVAVQENTEALPSNQTRAWDCGVFAATNFRVRASAWTSGTANVGITLSAAPIEPAATVAVSSTPSSAATVNINVSTAATTQLVALTSGQSIYITHIHIMAAGTTNVSFVYGTGASCGTGTTTIDGPLPLTAQTGYSAGGGLGAVLVIPAGNAFCITNGSAIQVGGALSYAKF